jgi:hypothetical protein
LNESTSGDVDVLDTDFDGRKGSGVVARCVAMLAMIADYSQNVNLPHFESTQPGETYFHTPLSIYLFGVVDTSNDDHLIGHLFREGDGKKGGM